MRWIVVLGLGLLIGVSASQETVEIKSPKQKYSYALGMDFGNQLRKRSIDVEAAAFMKGFKDALSGGHTLLTEEQARSSINELQLEMKRKQILPPRPSPEEELRAGRAFLDVNKKKEGIVTLPSGLQYKALKPGHGKRPTDTDRVVCQYRGTFIDGTEFDSSYRTGHPATFAVKDVIAGWREGLKLMAAGSRYQLFIPSELAYGAEGAGPGIGPNATLIFEVELLAIK